MSRRIDPQIISWPFESSKDFEQFQKDIKDLAYPGAMLVLVPNVFVGAKHIGKDVARRLKPHAYRPVKNPVGLANALAEYEHDPVVSMAALARKYKLPPEMLRYWIDKRESGKPQR